MNWFGWILAGFLVGFGTRLGYGDTISHMISGVPMLNKNSIIATLIIIASGIVMNTFRGKLGFVITRVHNYDHKLWSVITILIFVLMMMVAFMNLIFKSGRK